MSAKLPIAWTSHLPEKEREDFAKAVRNSNFVLERLVHIIEGKIEAEDRWASSPEIFADPNYSHRIAHTGGYITALRDVLKLITLKG